MSFHREVGARVSIVNAFGFSVRDFEVKSLLSVFELEKIGTLFLFVFDGTEVGVLHRVNAKPNRDEYKCWFRNSCFLSIFFFLET